MSSEINKEYQVVVYREGLWGSIFLGGSKFNPEKFGNFLNEHANNGWKVITMEREIRRTLLFFKREAMLVIMGRDKK
jgi:hypothetical protein